MSILLVPSVRCLCSFLLQRSTMDRARGGGEAGACKPQEFLQEVTKSQIKVSGRAPASLEAPGTSFLAPPGCGWLRAILGL